MKITIEVDDNRIADLLCTAFEGGSNYWARIERYEEPTSPDDLFPWNQGSNGAPLIVRDTEYDPAYAARYAGDPGYGIHRECEPDEPGLYRLDRAAVEAGMHLLATDKRYVHHFANFMQSEYDAVTGDVFLQFCIFGNVIYT